MYVTKFSCSSLLTAGLCDMTMNELDWVPVSAFFSVFVFFRPRIVWMSEWKLSWAWLRLVRCGWDTLIGLLQHMTWVDMDSTNSSKHVDFAQAECLLWLNISAVLRDTFAHTFYHTSWWGSLCCLVVCSWNEIITKRWNGEGLHHSLCFPTEKYVIKFKFTISSISPCLSLTLCVSIRAVKIDILRMNS